MEGRTIVFALMLGTLMLPYQATLVPQYVLFYRLAGCGASSDHTARLFCRWRGADLPAAQFMMGLPRELDESAMIDGANPLQIWWYIIMPLCRPAIATVTVLLLVGTGTT